MSLNHIPPLRNTRNRHARRWAPERLEGRCLLAAGDLDPSFDGDGRVLTDFGASWDIAYDAVLQSDGKVVVAGNSAGGPTRRDVLVSRYLPNGQLDATFSGDGIATADFRANNDSARAVAFQPDGKIVAAGSSYQWNDFTFPADADVLLVRYLPDGQLDRTFGSQGQVKTRLTSDTDFAADLAVLPDGKILIVGGTNGNGNGDQLFLARYHPNGALDTSFGKKGILYSIQGHPNRMLLQPDGKALVTASTSQGVALVRYLPNGTLDASFGVNGVSTVKLGDLGAYATDLLIQPSGMIVLLARSESFGTALLRFLPNGSALDPTFGVGGIATYQGTPATDMHHALASLPDGKLAVAGSISFESGFAVARFSGVDGSLDASFGVNGVAVADFVSDPTVPVPPTAAQSLVALADGRIVAAGYADRKLALARFLGDSTALVAKQPVLASAEKLATRATDVLFTASFSAPAWNLPSDAPRDARALPTSSAVLTGTTGRERHAAQRVAVEATNYSTRRVRAADLMDQRLLVDTALLIDDAAWWERVD